MVCFDFYFNTIEIPMASCNGDTMYTCNLPKFTTLCNNRIKQFSSYNIQSYLAKYSAFLSKCVLTWYRLNVSYQLQNYIVMSSVKKLFKVAPHSPLQKWWWAYQYLKFSNQIDVSLLFLLINQFTTTILFYAYKNVSCCKGTFGPPCSSFVCHHYINT